MLLTGMAFWLNFRRKLGVKKLYTVCAQVLNIKEGDSVEILYFKPKWNIYQF